MHWWKYIFVQQVLSTNIEVLMSKKLGSKDIESKTMKSIELKKKKYAMKSLFNEFLFPNIHFQSVCFYLNHHQDTNDALKQFL